MALPPFAFSVHNFISSIGADAGFAAIIGLAILVLLYFAHARETANLREEAELLTQRLQQAEARVAQLSRVQPAAQPGTPIAEEELEDEAALAPFAPIGTAAPALASATHLLPLPAPPMQAPEPEGEEAAAAPPVAALAMVGAGAQAPAASPAPVPRPTVFPLSPAAAPSPGPAGDASSEPDSPPEEATAGSDEAPEVPADGESDLPPAAAEQVPGPATDAGGNGAGHQPPAARAADEPAWIGPISASRNTPTPAAPRSPERPGAALRQPSMSRQLPPLERPRTRRQSRLGRGVAVALVALAAVAIAVVLFALSSVGSSKRQPGTQTTNALSATRSSAAPFKPSSVTVAVLNGTTTYQLAHRIGQRLAGVGYKEGAIATAANQTATSTVVAYVTGASRRANTANRLDALHVAQSLGLRSSAVKPVDQSTLQVACPASAACTANVVVTVGADLASQ